ncbi:MAG: hypothetical protein LUC30_00965 [Clostridiales bacterium]|nr:hypothetical protein [Clostridiales bacterium]
MTNQWKRLLSGLLALAMTFSLFVPAMATSVEDETDDVSAAVADVAEETADAEEVVEDDSQPADDVSENAEAEETAEPEEAVEETSEEPAAEVVDEASDEPAAEVEDETSDELAAEVEDETDADEEEDDTASYVAEYNDVQYETLQAAFDAVGEAWKEDAPAGEFESSSTITMLADVTENISFSITPHRRQLERSEPDLGYERSYPLRHW